MKKVMVMAAVVCAAVAAQAFPLYYSLSGFTDSLGNLYNGKITVSWNAISGCSGSGSTEKMVTDGSVAEFLLGEATYTGGGIYTGILCGTAATDETGATWTGMASGSSFGPEEPTSIKVSDTGYTGTWTAAPVPEPTSGLLLLLGMAGLALKRKRA